MVCVKHEVVPTPYAVGMLFQDGGHFKVTGRLVGGLLCRGVSYLKWFVWRGQSKVAGQSGGSREIG